MKRAVGYLLTVVLVVASLFISCSNDMDVSGGEASVRFVSSDAAQNSRGLNKTNPVFSASDLVWKYEAKKIDDSGLSTGETTEKTLIGTDGKLTNSVGPFSLGEWEFTLYAYTDMTHADANQVAYSGSTHYVIKKSDNSVAVTVEAFMTGANGFIKFPSKGEISLVDVSGNPINEFTETITITNVKTSDEIKSLENSEERTIEVPSGFYKVTVSYSKPTNPTIVYGENSIYLNVWDYLTTTIGGSLDEITSNTVFDPTDGTASTSIVISDTTKDISMKVDSSPADAESEAEPTTVNIPAGVLTGDKATLSVKAYSADTVGDFIVSSAEDGAVVGGLDIKLAVDNSSVTEFSTPVTITTYTAKGLSGVNVKYNGDGTQPTDVSYDSATGKIVFKTTHFSEFYVTSSSVVIITDTSTAYDSLKTAFAEAEPGAEIKVLRDFALNEKVYITKDATFDLNGHAITLGDTITNTGSLFFIRYNSTLTVEDSSKEKSGKIDFSTERMSGGYPAVWGVFLVYPYDKNQHTELIINGGTFISEFFPIGGNGTALEGSTTRIEINDGKIVSEEGPGIYHPQIGDLVINNCEIVAADTAVEIRDGNLIINGGVFEATKTPASSTPNGNGPTSIGSAIAIAQHTTNNPIKVTINDGTFKAYSAVYESNPQNNPAEAIEKISLDIKGGVFEAINGGSAVIYSEDLKGFISGGTYSHKPSVEYLGTNCYVKESGDKFLVEKYDGTVVYSEEDFEKTALDPIIPGSSFKDDAANNLNGNYILVSDIVVDHMLYVPEGSTAAIDLNGHKIESRFEGFSIGNWGNLTITDSSVDKTGLIYNSCKTFGNDNYGHDTIRNFGSLTINGGTFGDMNIVRTDANDVNYGASLRNQTEGVVTINGGFFTTGDNYWTNKVENDGFSYAIKNYGSLTVKNWYVYGRMNGGVAADAGTMYIEDGKIEITNPTSYHTFTVNAESEAKTYISGGEYINTTNGYLFSAFNGMSSWEVTDLEANGYYVTGGTFIEDGVEKTF